MASPSAPYGAKFGRLLAASNRSLAGPISNRSRSGKGQGNRVPCRFLSLENTRAKGDVMRKFVAPNTGHAGAWNKRCKSTSCQILFSPYLANRYHMGDIRVHRLPAAPPACGLLARCFDQPSHRHVSPKSDLISCPSCISPTRSASTVKMARW